MDKTLQIIVGLITLISAIGGFIYWHFKVINSFRDQVNELKLQMKDLAHKDELQQLTIEELKNLWPVLHAAVEKIEKKKQLEE